MSDAPQPNQSRPPAAHLRLARRSFLSLGLAAVATFLLPRSVTARKGVLAADAAKAASASPLIYVSPLKRNGKESTCHAEVWFVRDGSDLLVVTSPDRWRAAAIGKGLGRARIWIGDYGVWKNAKGKFKEAPMVIATASIDADTAAHRRALTAFGAKYSAEWSKWGPRFEKGLASGERVLIRYTPA